VVIGALLPVSLLAATLGFRALPVTFYGAIAGLAICYLARIELVKGRFYRSVL